MGLDPKSYEAWRKQAREYGLLAYLARGYPLDEQEETNDDTDAS